MYINHEKARITFQTLVNSESPDWIIVSGGEDTGKTSFIKEVCPRSITLFNDPGKALFYLEGFIPYISLEVQLYLKNFLSSQLWYWDKIKEKYNYNFINDIIEGDIKDIIRTLIHLDICKQDYKYAQFLSNGLCSKYRYIVLEDFYKCDQYSYEWLLKFSENYLKNWGYIITVCDFEKDWESKKIYTIFRDIPEFIDIKEFESASDYFNVLKENIYFENFEILNQISVDLFRIYQGDARLLFKTIKIYGENKESNDYNRKMRILKIAQNLTISSFRYTNKIDKLVLETLALVSIPVSVGELCKIIEVNTDIIQEICLKHYNNDLLQFDTRDDGASVCYSITDPIIQNIILQTIDKKTKEFLYSRILNLCRSKILDFPIELQIRFTFKVKDNSAEKMIAHYFSESQGKISEEKKMELVNQLYSLELNKDNIFSYFEMAKQAYEYGYFHTALKILKCIEPNNKNSYDFYMLLGGVQHLLLLAEAPQSFKIASSLPHISLSQKLSAINREIMSLNQADLNAADLAKHLYDVTLERYKNEKCIGLVELYRNTNNSYDMEKALEYTIKGYCLALELNNELEKYKCMHNICMIRLHQGKYHIPLNRPELDVEPDFNLVDNYFAKYPQLYHKRAYPLLDQGTYEMFKYILEGDSKFLKSAKAYYSKAQLYAKSFYARHIAETSLLIVNTHLYINHPQMIDSIKQNRRNLFAKYKLEKIVDYRVNRKILLSLAVSATLTKDMEEGLRYLNLAKPYISGPEEARYHNLLSICNCESPKVATMNKNEDFYYSSAKFVPWLISLGH